MLAALLSLVPLAIPQESPLPLDLAFSARELSVYERSALSPDGRFVVYAIHAEPEEGGDRGMRAGSRSTPGGTPVSAIGVRLWISDLAGGEARELAPPNSNAVRPSWSPDGGKVAFYCDAGGALRLWVYDLVEGRARPVSPAPVRCHIGAGDEPSWTPDGSRLLVGLLPAASGAKPAPQPESAAPKGAPGAEPPEVHVSGGAPAAAAGVDVDSFARENVCDLALVDAATGDARIVVSHTSTPAPSLGRLSPSGRRIAYASVFRARATAGLDLVHDLVVVDAASGERLHFEGDVPLDPNTAELAFFRWHRADDQLQFVKARRATLLDVSGAGPAKVVPLAHPLGDVDERLVSFSADGKRAIFGLRWPGDPDEAALGSRDLVLAPLDGSAVETVSIAENWRFTALLEERPGRLWQRHPNEVLAVGRDLPSAEPALLAIDLESGAAAPVLKGRFRLRGIGATPRGELLARYENAATPPDLVLFGPRFDAPRAVSRVEPRYAGAKLGTVESFATPVAAYNGKPRLVHTSVVLPPGAKRGDRLPAVAFVYGGARISRRGEEFGGGDVATIPVAVFSSRGYAALLCDSILGPEGKGGEPVSELASSVLPQVLRAAELGYVDAAKVAVMGQSYGGYSTAALLSASPLFRCGVAVSGSYDLPGLFAWMDPRGANFHGVWSESGQGRMGTHPWADLRRYLDNSPYYRADRIRAPLLLIHGESDDTCPVEDARKMFLALQRLGREAELAVYPEEGHVVTEWSRAHAIDAAERVLRFLGKNLRGD